MELKFNVTGARRKALVTAMGEILEVKPKYLKTPTMAYEVDYFTVDKVGRISFDDRADSEEIENLLDKLADKGFVAEEQALPSNDTTEETQGEHSQTVALTIEIPRDMFSESALVNLENLIKVKGELIKKALGVNQLEVEITDDKVSFPWFDEVIDPDTISTYTKFITALCDMAKTQKRINNKEKSAENEKYAFRCFLLRLGFIGNEYKQERKILLKNLTGSSAFKNGGANSEIS